MNYKSLFLREREEIFLMRSRQASIQEISKKLDRNPSTISRELKRCRAHHRWHSLSWKEKARVCHDDAITKRSKKRKRFVVLINFDVQHYVESKLKIGWSPETISENIFSDISEEVSHEAIYLFAYKHQRDWIKYFVQKGKTPRQGYKTNRAKKAETRANKRSHETRPPACIERTELGHLESDLIVSCKGGRSALQVTVDRVSRRAWLKLLSSREACEARRNLFQIVNSEERLISCTVDNGAEHSDYSNLESVFKEREFMVYYCDPHSPWQRGTVEAVNGIIRRWFPKGTNFDHVIRERVAEVEALYNSRPMKVLEGKTPTQVWNHILQQLAA